MVIKNELNMKLSKLLLKIALLILVIFSCLSIYSIILVFKDSLIKLNFDPFSEMSFSFFLNAFKEYNVLIGATLGIFSVYWSLTTFYFSNEEKSKADELMICDYYANNTLPLASKLISEMAEFKLVNQNVLLKVEFTSEEFRIANSHDFNLTFQFLEKKQNKLLHIETLTALEYFSYRVFYGQFEGEIAFKNFGKAYVSQVSALYPVIAISRSQEDSNNHFQSIVSIYKKWSAKLED